MQKISTLIFDLGGVLIDWNPEYVFRQTIPNAERRAFFFQNICTHDWNVEQDAGRPIAVATELLVTQFPEWTSEIKDFYGRWEEMLGGPINETVELLRELREQGQHRLIALTNWSAETFPVALERYEFLQWFEGIVVSGDEKRANPSRKFIKPCWTVLMLNREEAVFIDDSHANILGAEALNIKGIHFQSPAQLRQQLQEWNVVG